MFFNLLVKMVSIMPKRLIWVFAKKYVAGSTVDKGRDACLLYNEKGMVTTTDVLGEFISDLKEADDTVAIYLSAIEAYEKAGVKGGFSIKPTAFGLLQDKEACYENMRKVIAAATEVGRFVRIDMEDSSCTSDEIALYLRLKKEFPGHVGLVLQAYLKRSHQDLLDMLVHHSEDSPLDFRLCKGIYKESASIAFKGYQEVRDEYLKLLDIMLKNKVVVGIATHDEYLVEGAYELLAKYDVNPRYYEFQMLLGVAPRLRSSIMGKGHRLRIYIPFGKDWHGYSIRRFKENPNVMKDIVKAFFSRR